MTSYEDALRGLNTNQKQAATTIEGPVLVIAGPGTGKTQLLTTRIAHILAKTDTLPHNILCLTFTDSATQTMRERLSGLVGQAAYDVTISTYHAFGSELIRRFPDHFPEMADMRPADDLTIDTIFRSIIDRLPFSNPLKFSESYIGDIKTLVSDAKRTLLTPEDVHGVANHNERWLAKAQPVVAETLEDFTRLSKSSIPVFAKLATRLADTADVTQPLERVLPLSTLLLQELHEALEQAGDTSTPPLRKWKDKWLVKDSAGRFAVTGEATNQKLHAGADIYTQYLQELAARKLFDYDDMILRAVNTLEQNADLRYTLQEQYLYILLDEFQDTNGAQLRLVELLTDSPVNEGRPNVLAVGDDDQAIYAFQGANYSHMLQFQQMYRDVLVVPLTENYRSHPNILHTASKVAEQIEERLHHHFPQIQKNLTAANKNLTKDGIVERREAKSDVGQFAWTAKRIKELIAGGVNPSEIAVLAPKHKYLEPLIPFLRQENVPVRYEKRENVLDDPAINQLLRMSELVVALSSNQRAAANALWAQVLSFAFWQLPTSRIWQLSWQASDDHEDWTEVLLRDEQLKPIVLFFIRLSMLAGTETLEMMMDHLIGSAPLDVQEPGMDEFTLPFYDYYFGDTATALKNEDHEEIHPDFWSLLTSLTILRTRLRDWRAMDDGERLTLRDFIAYVEAHRAADIKILNTSPYQEADDAVQLMTAYKSKGQEWGAVFLLATSDEVWGSKARMASAHIGLPANLQFIRYAGATEDERLRLFYVALTRAKTHLYLASYTANYAGKLMTRLKYLDETAEEDGEVHSPLLPEGKQKILLAEDGVSAPTTELAAYWQQRHTKALSRDELRTLLKERLGQFQLSPTHVNTFIDLDKQGPDFFLMNVLLRFPKAPSTPGEYGNAIHETLEWIHRYNKRHGQLPDDALLEQTFGQRIRAKHISLQNTALLQERGIAALRVYLKQRAHTISPENEVEYNFRNENVFIGKAHMGGKIDKMIIDRTQKTIQIVDFKTGRGHQRWSKDPRLHRYQLQLYLYKAIVERSRSWRGYRVTDAYLEFIEPDETGTIRELHLDFNAGEQKHAEALAESIWQHVQELKIPDTSEYNATLKGIEDFENDLLRGLEQPEDPSGDQVSLSI